MLWLNEVQRMLNLARQEALDTHSLITREVSMTTVSDILLPCACRPPTRTHSLARNPKVRAIFFSRGAVSTPTKKPRVAGPCLTHLLGIVPPVEGRSNPRPLREPLWGWVLPYWHRVWRTPSGLSMPMPVTYSDISALSSRALSCVFCSHFRKYTQSSWKP